MIAHSHVLRQQFARQVLAQRFRRDDVTSCGDHLAIQPRFALSQVCVAGNHDFVSVHDAIRCLDAWFRAVMDSRDFRLLEDPCAVLFCRSRLAKAKIQGMQVSVGPMNQAA